MTWLNLEEDLEEEFSGLSGAVHESVAIAIDARRARYNANRAEERSQKRKALPGQWPNTPKGHAYMARKKKKWAEYSKQWLKSPKSEEYRKKNLERWAKHGQVWRKTEAGIAYHRLNAKRRAEKLKAIVVCEKACLNCGKTFALTAHRMSRKQDKFCRSVCALQFKKKTS